MAINLSKTKRIQFRGDIQLVEADGSPMVDDAGNPVCATVHSPASKQWQQADAERSRKKVENVGKRGMAGVNDNAREYDIDFLERIIIKFDDAIEHDDAKDKGIVRAILEDDQLGYIRQHLDAENGRWANFTKGSAKA